MVYDINPFPDIERGLINWAAEQFPEARVVDDLPNDYPTMLPVIEVNVDGGPADGVTWYAEVSVYVYARQTEGATGRSIARGVAVNLCSRMGVYPRHFGGVTADTVEVTSWPSRSKAHEPDEYTTCFSAEMTISLRRY